MLQPAGAATQKGNAIGCLISARALPGGVSFTAVTGVRIPLGTPTSGAETCRAKGSIPTPLSASGSVDPKEPRARHCQARDFDTQTGRGAQSSHLPFGLAGPLNIAHLPQAVAAAPAVKKRHPLQVLLGSGDFSV